MKGKDLTTRPERSDASNRINRILSKDLSAARPSVSYIGTVENCAKMADALRGEFFGKHDLQMGG